MILLKFIKNCFRNISGGNKKNPIVSKDNTYWGFIALGYLSTARSNLEDIKRFIKKNPIKKPAGHKDIEKQECINYTDYLIKKRDLWCPAIFCIKHSIELMIKWLGININNEYWGHHNLANLVNELRARLNEHALKDDVDAFAKLVDKYYRSDFFLTPLLKGRKLDKQNMFFRYPEDETGKKVEIDWTLLNEVSLSSIDEFLEDIRNLRSIFRKLSGQKWHYDYAKKFGISKKDMDKKLRKNISPQNKKNQIRLPLNKRIGKKIKY